MDRMERIAQCGRIVPVAAQCGTTVPVVRPVLVGWK
jgi:hypothetical protein